jgi:arylsulfatase A-like enzyme
LQTLPYVTLFIILPKDDLMLNVILIQLDSLCRHFLPTYSNTWVNAPNLTAFAQQSAVFDNHYVGSLPCMPARREIWTGTEEFWWRFWGPLEPWDRTIAHYAVRSGITTQFITDHYHLFEWGSHSYVYDFDGYDFIRGHEYDNWKTDSIREIPDWAETMVKRRGEEVLQYIRNVQDFVGEADFFAPKVMQCTVDWLQQNHAQKQFFLHIDCFDVHEPFHIPEPYRSMYTDLNYRQYNPWPQYGRTDEGAAALKPDEVEFVRAQFAGKLTMVDRWLGRVFDKLNEHNLMERTVVIITTDHGHYLGEHNRIGKPMSPMWHTLCHIPLLVWHPQGIHNGGRMNAITQTVDLYATVLELLGIENETLRSNVHSQSFAHCLTSPHPTHRKEAIYGYNNALLGITTDEYTLLRDHDSTAAPAYMYTNQIEQLTGWSLPIRKGRKRDDFSELISGRFIPGVDMPTWRMTRNASVPNPPREDLLYHNPSDPQQENNLAPQQGEVIVMLEDRLRAHMQSLHVPEEQYARLRL